MTNVPSFREANVQRPTSNAKAFGADSGINLCSLASIRGYIIKKTPMSGTEKHACDPLRYFTKLKRSLRKRILHHKFGEEWNTHGALQHRNYKSYEAYLEHQKAKLAIHDFSNYDIEFRTALRERLRALDVNWQGFAVLCLGARLGTEVKAFLDLGCKAIGIDLNPGKENQYVVPGDFHDLQFPPNSMDVVYTNSLDHAFDINRIAAEVLKVLKPGGMLIVEAVHGCDQGVHPGFFESFFWNSINELIAAFTAGGFKVILRNPITFPWPGELICLRPQ